MMREHSAAGSELVTMRALTDGYTLPEGSCPTFAAMYQDMQHLEADLHNHIFLENNILFPRTVEGAKGERVTVDL
ncbi:hypothetical protein KIPB_010447 [Kipferlia bialata]|uniref:Hemerythrin-like domain-containing protein n=1 Tax=Kipferlia bialata TaxID=797122 RepID=A0A9K3GMC7_9EUKA|nr:hypothetical protein KIPB_010447 [Kipferlia bialata]|eukprot:g10447.t1